MIQVCDVYKHTYHHEQAEKLIYEFFTQSTRMDGFAGGVASGDV